MLGAVEVRGKGHTVFGEFAQPREAEDLKAAGIGQDGPVPVHELVQPAAPGDHLVAGPHAQVIGVAEDDARTEVFQVLGADRLDRALGAHRHEDGSGDDAVGGVQFPCASLSVSAVYAEFSDMHVYALCFVVGEAEREVTPVRGQRSASSQASQSGLRAVQTSRPNRTR